MQFIGTIHAIRLRSIYGARFGSWPNEGSFDVPKVGMARMAGWIWSILAVRLLGYASIFLMAPARRTVGLDWINRTTRRHVAHTGRCGGRRPQAAPGLPRHRNPSRHSKQLQSPELLVRSSGSASPAGSVISDVRVGRDRRCYQTVIKLARLRVFGPGYAQNMSEWLVPGESFQTAWSVDCSDTNAHVISLLSDQWDTSGQKVGWHDQFDWLAYVGLSAPGLRVTRSRTRRCPHRRHVVGRPRWAATVQRRWRI